MGLKDLPIICEMVIEANGKKARAYKTLTFIEKIKAKRLYRKNKGKAVFIKCNNIFNEREITINIK